VGVDLRPNSIVILAAGSTNPIRICQPAGLQKVTRAYHSAYLKSYETTNYKIYSFDTPIYKNTMSNQAAWIMEPKGNPLEVKEAPMPTAGKGEVVIKNHAVAVNPVDCK
jgi:hypothetical protein